MPVTTSFSAKISAARPLRAGFYGNVAPLTRSTPRAITNSRSAAATPTRALLSMNQLRTRDEDKEDRLSECRVVRQSKLRPTLLRHCS